jgi:hypothetical protein
MAKRGTRRSRRSYNTPWIIFKIPETHVNSRCCTYVHATPADTHTGTTYECSVRRKPRAAFSQDKWSFVHRENQTYEQKALHSQQLLYWAVCIRDTLQMECSELNCMVGRRARHSTNTCLTLASALKLHKAGIMQWTNPSNTYTRQPRHSNQRSLRHFNPVYKCFLFSWRSHQNNVLCAL